MEPRTGLAPPAPGAAATAEVVIEGTPVSPGIATGPLYVYARDTGPVAERRITPAEVEGELARFTLALERAERDLRKIGALAQEKLGDDAGRIFEAQALMLDDATLTRGVHDAIATDHYGAEYAVHRVLGRNRDLLAAAPTEYLRERAADLLDLEERLLVHLRRGRMLSAVDEGSVVAAPSLTAADVVLFSRRGIAGIVLQYGGQTDHVSIMARALGIPTVVGLKDLPAFVQHGDPCVLDGRRGQLIVRPTPETAAYYGKRRARYRQLVRAQRSLVPLPPETLDGHRVTLRANLEFEEEIELLQRYGAEGIGLFRTEILVLMRRRLSITEDEQYAIYAKIAREAGPGGTTFRVLDLGGDKMLPLGHREENPFLGWRGVRVLLDKPDLAVPQLRAILRASAHGPVRLLVPMVTEVAEVLRFRQLVEETRAALVAEHRPVAEHVPLGIMVEVPAVALLAERFTPYVDFFSVGSNDLTQYTLAVDRGNDLVGRLFHDLHPAVLTLMARMIAAAHAAGRPVSLCGELAGNPLATPVLVGLGFDELSLSPVFLPDVKQTLRAIRFDDAQALAAACLTAPDAGTVSGLAEAFLAERDALPGGLEE